jgi:hypothetical protein
VGKLEEGTDYRETPRKEGTTPPMEDTPTTAEEKVPTTAEEEVPTTAEEEVPTTAEEKVPMEEDILHLQPSTVGDADEVGASGADQSRVVVGGGGWVVVGDGGSGYVREGTQEDVAQEGANTSPSRAE